MAEHSPELVRAVLTSKRVRERDALLLGGSLRAALRVAPAERYAQEPVGTDFREEACGEIRYGELWVRRRQGG